MAKKQEPPACVSTFQRSASAGMTGYFNLSQGTCPLLSSTAFPISLVFPASLFYTHLSLSLLNLDLNNHSGLFYVFFLFSIVLDHIYNTSVFSVIFSVSHPLVLYLSTSCLRHPLWFSCFSFSHSSLFLPTPHFIARAV